MTEQPFHNPPELPDEAMERIETTVRETARYFAYPPTPDIASATRRQINARPRSFGWLRLAAAALVSMVILTLTIPEVRAFVETVIRVGVVEVFFVEPSPTPTVTPTHQPTARPTPTPFSLDPTAVISPLDLSGETTLLAVREAVSFEILLPAYPADLGQPDHVFLQDFDGDVVTLLWMETENPTRVRLLLQLLDESVVAAKYYPMEGNNESVTVDGRYAIWLTDVHESYLMTEHMRFARLVDMNVLIWTKGRVTYRLETRLPLEEALQIAESVE